jgi:cyanophycin synthetase
MIAPASHPELPAPVDFPHSFHDWRARVERLSVPPVVAVAGSRGKTTVVRLLDAIFRQAGLRTALWTNYGVEINGRRQSGELVPWSRAVSRLADGSLDVGIQELDWATVHAVGLPGASYPLVAVTNLCVNNDSCLVQSETRLAMKALTRVRAAAREDGALVLNGEDFGVAPHENDHAPAILVGQSRDTPLIRNQLKSGGMAAWVSDGTLVVGGSDRVAPFGRSSVLPFAFGGAVSFQVHNALIAGALARACGISTAAIAEALAMFSPSPKVMPGSFNVLPVSGATVVVDRPAPSWFLRPALRAVGHLPGRRLLTVAGHLAPIPLDDLTETGRLLGRSGGVLILHSADASSERFTLLRQGILANEVPPIIIHCASERQALNRALDILRPGDTTYVLADNPPAVLRAVERARGASASAAAPSA